MLKQFPTVYKLTGCEQTDNNPAVTVAVSFRSPPGVETPTQKHGEIKVRALQQSPK